MPWPWVSSFDGAAAMATRGSASAAPAGRPAASAAAKSAFDLEHVSPATRLLEKRRQMFEVQEALEKKKDEFASQQATFRQREDKLRKKDQNLQESLTRFNRFLQETEAKTSRAENRAEEERKQTVEKEQEIEALKKELHDGHAANSEFQRLLSENIKYQRYLESVVDYASEDFSEVADVLNRHRTLRGANEDLRSQQLDTGSTNDAEQSRFYGYVKDRTNEILNINNQIAFLQKDLEESEKKRIVLASQVEKQAQDSSNKALELGQILMAVENLVQRCLSKKRKRHARKVNTEGGGGSSGTGNTNSAAGQNASGASSSSSSSSKRNAADKVDLAKKCEKASRDLDIIQQYIGDYEEIFNQCPKESRNGPRS